MKAVYINHVRTASWAAKADSFKNTIWTLRISCLKTLARKHKKNFKWALTIFTINVEAKSPVGAIFSLPSTQEMSLINKKFLLTKWFQQPDAESLFQTCFLRLN